MSKDFSGLTETRSIANDPDSDFVGVAAGMPGTANGFTMCTFPGAVVPPSTKLYTKPQYAATPEVLKPFADFADALSEDCPDTVALAIFADGRVMFGPNGGATVGDLRKARDAARSAKILTQEEHDMLVDVLRGYKCDAGNGSYYKKRIAFLEDLIARTALENA